MRLGQGPERPSLDTFQPKEKGEKYPIISLIALQQRLISDEVFDECIKACAKSKNKNRAIMTYLKEKGSLEEEEARQLDDIYNFFITRQNDARFGALCAGSKMVPRMIVGLALEEQLEWYTKTGEKKLLGALFVENGMISRRQCTLLLQKQKRERLEDTIDISASETSMSDFSMKEKSPESPGKETVDNTVPDAEAEALSRVPMKEIRNEGLILKIQNDGLKAYLLKTSGFNASTTIDEIRTIIDANHIAFGVVDRKKLKEFIGGRFAKGHHFPVANGIPPIEHQPAQIDYVFDNQHLKAGALGEDGSIDFKDRGRLPEVKAGDLLVEKVPGISGKSGCNVYGETLAPESIDDSELKCGNGVELSGDGLKGHAVISGYPRADINGTVSVVQVYSINGNVDYSTGHINFDGNVMIAGTIKNGFKVTAHDVDADSIEGGIIQSSGDVRIREGISKAKVQARGSVFARYIHHSEVTCMGSLDVHKEILDSTAIVNGTCILETGRILASTIYAKLGARVHTVGTEQTRQSTIFVGVSKFTEMENNRLSSLIEQIQKDIDDNYSTTGRIDSEIDAIYHELTNTQMALEKLETTIEQVKTKSKEKASKEAENVQNILKFNIEKSLEKIEHLHQKKETLETEKSEIEITINLNTQDVQKYVKEMLLLKQIDNQTPPNARLDVIGQIVPGTRVQGKNSKMVVKHQESRVRISEVMIQATGEGEAGACILDMTPFR